MYSGIAAHVPVGVLEGQPCPKGDFYDVVDRHVQGVPFRRNRLVRNGGAAALLTIPNKSLWLAGVSLQGLANPIKDCWTLLELHAASLLLNIMATVQKTVLVADVWLEGFNQFLGANVAYATHGKAGPRVNICGLSVE